MYITHKRGPLCLCIFIIYMPTCIWVMMTNRHTCFLSVLPLFDVAARYVAGRFAGCLDDVTINGRTLGLWNFQQTRDCGACRTGPRSAGWSTV